MRIGSRASCHQIHVVVITSQYAHTLTTLARRCSLSFHQCFCTVCAVCVFFDNVEARVRCERTCSTISVNCNRTTADGFDRLFIRFFFRFGIIHLNLIMSKKRNFFHTIFVLTIFFYKIQVNYLFSWF